MYAFRRVDLGEGLESESKAINDAITELEHLMNRLMSPAAPLNMDDWALWLDETSLATNLTVAAQSGYSGQSAISGFSGPSGVGPYGTQSGPNQIGSPAVSPATFLGFDTNWFEVFDEGQGAAFVTVQSGPSATFVIDEVCVVTQPVFPLIKSIKDIGPG